MMRYLWREVKDKFRDDVVVCGSQTLNSRYRTLSITTRVVVDQSSFHRLAILRIGVLRPGIFLMAGVA